MKQNILNIMTKFYVSFKQSNAHTILSINEHFGTFLNVFGVNYLSPVLYRSL